MTNKFKAGQKIRVIADTFEKDTHGLPIGSIHTIDTIKPPVKFEELDPFMQLMLAMEGMENLDLPSRIHVRTGNGHNDFANLVFADVELVSEDAVEAPKTKTIQVRMLEDDICEGFYDGDVFTATYDEKFDEYTFIDNDGDSRSLSAQEHEII